MLKFLVAFLFLFSYPTKSLCQKFKGRSALLAYHDSKNIGLGYAYSFADPNPNNLHLLEVNINRTRYGGLHGGGFSYGLGSEIGLNTRNFTIGPKITGVIYYSFLAIGSELIAYTDFDKITLRYVPMIGIGGEKFRLTINPHVILTNKKFQPIDRGSISFIINLSFRRKPVPYNN